MLHFDRVWYDSTINVQKKPPKTTKKQMCLYIEYCEINSSDKSKYHEHEESHFDLILPSEL